MHRAIVQFSEAQIRLALGLPDDTRIVAVRTDPFSSNQIEFVVDHAGLPFNGEGEQPPVVRLERRWVV